MPSLRINNTRCLRALFFIIAAMLFIGCFAKSSERHKSKKKQFLAESMYFHHAAVSSDDHTCSEMGKSILVKGGSAVDAAITVQFCVEVVNAHSTGIGGGGFMLIYDKKTGKSSALDFRETLPLNYKDNEKKLPGELILVPGVLRGLEKAHRKFGKLAWKDLLQPVIILCEVGHKISKALGKALEAKADMIMKDEALRELFAPNGTLLVQGDILKRPRLAKTFRRIAAKGADTFYAGKMAKQIAKDIKELGGFITRNDLRKYKAIARRPLKTNVKGLQMLSLPAPGSGALVSLALKILTGFNWTRDDITNPGKAPLTYHRIVEAFKFAYAPNTFLGDPSFTNYTKDVIRYMLDDKVAEILRSRIDNTSHTVDYYGPHSTEPPEDKRGTTHISVLGPEGDAVALTSTINGYFGSKILSKKLGFFYNNELADFSEFWPHVYKLRSDKKVPGKRPMSNASPIIFLDQNGNVSGVFGAAGGHFIPTALVMTIGNWLFFGDTLKEAIAKPRLHCQLFPPTVVYEDSFPSHIIQPLHHYNHSYITDSTYDVTGQQNAAMGVIQAIVKQNDGLISAEADDRKGGKPSGY